MDEGEQFVVEISEIGRARPPRRDSRSASNSARQRTHPFTYFDRRSFAELSYLTWSRLSWLRPTLVQRSRPRRRLGRRSSRGRHSRATTRKLAISRGAARATLMALNSFSIHSAHLDSTCMLISSVVPRWAAFSPQFRPHPSQGQPQND